VDAQPNPHVGPVADLFDPYLTFDAKQNGGKTRGAGSAYMCWWLDRHPGRWALVGIGNVGIQRDTVTEKGYRLGMRTGPGGHRHTYAQKPHPEGISLLETIHRFHPTPPKRHIELPALGKSDFNWTPEELAEAVRIMRENLYPVRQPRGPRKKQQARGA
jgi:hypothetical protein